MRFSGCWGRTARGRRAIIDKAKIIARDTPAKLKEEIGGDLITIHSPEREKLNAKLSTLPWVNRVEPHDGAVTITLDHAERHVAELAQLSATNGITIESLSIRKPTLEDVFLYFTGRTMREEEIGSKEHMLMMHRMWRR